jgi:hypothetical protein
MILSKEIVLPSHQPIFMELIYINFKTKREGGYFPKKSGIIRGEILKRELRYIDSR